MTDDTERPRSFASNRYSIGLLAFAAALLFVLWRASNAVLLIFAGILFGAFLDALTRMLGKVTPWSRGVRLAIVCSALGILVMAIIAWGGTAIAMQGSEFVSTLREQINQVLAWLEQRGISVPQGTEAAVDEAITETGGREGGESALQSLLPDLQGLFGTAWTAIAIVLGVVGDALIIIFLGIFFAVQPAIYRNALLLLVPPGRRSHVGDVLDESGQSLRHWLLGQALTMSAIFLFVWLGLTLVGVGPALALGLQAGLLAFIPTLGPLIAGIAIVLAGFAGGIWSVVGALAVYLAAQGLESYILTPMIQKRAISVPPAFLFATQIVLGLLFGLYGLALATPLAAVARIFILRFYVEDALGDRTLNAEAP